MLFGIITLRTVVCWLPPILGCIWLGLFDIGVVVDMECIVCQHIPQVGGLNADNLDFILAMTKEECHLVFGGAVGSGLDQLLYVNSVWNNISVCGQSRAFH